MEQPASDVQVQRAEPRQEMRQEPRPAQRQEPRQQQPREQSRPPRNDQSRSPRHEQPRAEPRQERQERTFDRPPYERGGRDHRRRDDDLGPAVLAFGGDVPAFMSLPRRPVRTAEPEMASDQAEG